MHSVTYFRLNFLKETIEIRFDEDYSMRKVSKFFSIIFSGKKGILSEGFETDIFILLFFLFFNRKKIQIET